MKKYTSERFFEGNICINACGSEFLNKRDTFSLRENGRVDYLFNYIKEGVGYFEENQKMQKIEKGMLLIYPPNVKQYYIFKKEDVSETFWCHFSGNYAKMLNIDNIKNPVVLKIKNTNAFESAFNRMVKAFYLKEPFWEKTCEGYLTVLISLVAKELNFPESKTAITNNKRLEQVLNEMHTNISSDINIEYFASICGLSKSRFLHVFKERLGVSPYRYQIELRIEKACDLLENSDISVTECSKIVGYEDVSYFCRIFKKITGKTPASFKK